MNDAKTWSYKTDNAAMAWIKQLASAFNLAIMNAADSGLAVSFRCSQNGIEALSFRRVQE